MSIFGAMTTAISGLTAQSTAFSNIGDNLANSQTTGYKEIDTSFEDYVTTSSLQNNGSDAVVAQPVYNNSIQGVVTQTQKPLNLAISGHGFFPVATRDGEANGQPTFSSQTEYTRQGDFTLDQNGYVVNSSSHTLMGWPVDSTGAVDPTKLVPLQVGQGGYAPVATSSAALAANLPASPSSSTPATTEMPVIDAQGTKQYLELSWTPTSTANVWALSVAKQGASSPLATFNVAFGTAGNSAAPQGTISGVTLTSAAGTGTGSTYSANTPATLAVTPDFGLGAQPMTINLGTFGGTDGVTQFAGTSYNLVSLSQNGVAPGQFSGVSVNTDGKIVVNYDNGSSHTLGQVPIVTFNNPDALQRQDGQAFLATQSSGSPRTNAVGGNGAGDLVVSSVEGSNVDIASEFTKLIVAQRAYSANTKMITTADDMLQQTIDMKR